MTDLDERFRPLIDESAQWREPVEQIEVRASAFRRRDRRRHRAQGFLAGAVVIALVVGAVAFVRGCGRASAPPAHSGPAPRVTVGWQPYDFGLARLSIPPAWRATTGCPSPETLLMENVSAPIGCGGRAAVPSIAIARLLPDPMHLVIKPNANVNGIPYALTMPKCECDISAIVKVPALDVELSFHGQFDWRQVLETLTRSTYARLLQQPFGPTPSSWKTVASGGVAVSVPASWAVEDLRTTGFCGPEADTAYYGPITIVPSCPFLTGVRRPSDSVQVSPGSEPTDGRTSTRHGLRLRRAPQPLPLDTTLTFTVLGSPHPVTVSVGLGTDPAIARGILGSIRPAS
jgi:hypothetical protein